MSSLRAEVGTATVELVAAAEVQQRDGTSTRYDERDLMDATARLLLAVNTPRAVAWAHALFDLTKTTDTREA